MSEKDKEITIEDEDFKRVLEELVANRDAIKKAEELSQESFRIWLLDTIRQIAKSMGLVIAGLDEFVKDFGYAVKSGWQEGAEIARGNSYRARDKRRKL